MRSMPACAEIFYSRRRTLKITGLKNSLTPVKYFTSYVLHREENIATHTGMLLIFREEIIVREQYHGLNFSFLYFENSEKMTGLKNSLTPVKYFTSYVLHQEER